jgi:adenylate cyclase
LIEGTIQRADRRVRISAQLIEAGGGRQVWAEVFDRVADDLLAAADDVAHRVLLATRWKMAAWDGIRVDRADNEARTITDRLAQAARLFYTPSADSFREAIAILDRVLRDDPVHPMALGMRSFAMFVISSFKVVPMTPEDREDAIRMAELGLERRGESDFLHWLRGTLALYLQKDYDLANRQAERALEINPHYAPALRLRGEALCFGGDPAKGLVVLSELLDVDPQAPANAIVFWVMSLAHFSRGELAAALAHIERALLRTASMPDFRLARAAVLSLLGRVDEAAAMVESVREREGPLNLRSIRHPPFRYSQDQDCYSSALRAAQLPE